MKAEVNGYGRSVWLHVEDRNVVVSVRMTAKQARELATTLAWVGKASGVPKEKVRHKKGEGRKG